MRTHLERLRVPVLHPVHRGHLVEPIGQAVQLLHPVGEADGELFGEELRGAEQGSWYRSKLAYHVHIPLGCVCIGEASECHHDIPTDGRSPNWTICRKLTPVAGKLA